MPKLLSVVLIVLLELVSFHTFAGRKTASSEDETNFLFKNEHAQELVLSSTIGRISLLKHDSDIVINTTYGYFFTPHLEGAIELRFENDYEGVTFMSIFFDSIYNFQANYNNSYFVLFGFGLNSISGRSNSESTTGFKFGGGKRLPLWGAVSLMPMVWAQKDGSTSMVTTIMPLNFSVLF